MQRRMRGLTAGEIMTREVVCLRGEQTVLEATRTLVERGISGAPVVDERGVLLGLVTEEDLLGAFYEEAPGIESETLERCHVLGAGLITRRVVAVRPEQRAHEIARAMIVRKIKRVPVVDAEGRVIGVVSRRDILRALADRALAVPRTSEAGEPEGA
ncbi:MAG: hypothetical protein KatS3mg102_1574 [Planctomycetota bacterium]|nr:MAG: hypothetical protein KatS3mg102_1574 [Planctomycetota bacterium]